MFLKKLKVVHKKYSNYKLKVRKDHHVIQVHSWLSLERMSDTGLFHICILSCFLLFSTLSAENIWTKGIIIGLQAYFNISTLFHPSPPPSQGIKMVVQNKPFPQNTLPVGIQTLANLLITPNFLSNTYVFHQLFIKLKITLVQHLFSTSELHTSFSIRQWRILRTFFLGFSLQTLEISFLFLRRKPSPGGFWAPGLVLPQQKSPSDGHAGACLPQGKDHSLLLLVCVRFVCVSAQKQITAVKLCPPLSGTQNDHMNPIHFNDWFCSLTLATYYSVN